MTKTEMIISVVESLGYKPQVGDEGDIRIRYQMKNIFFMVGQEDEQYVAVLFPWFSDVHEGEEALALATCNKMNREMRLVKMCIDQEMKGVSASCEFYYTDMDSLKSNVEHSLDILGIVRSTYLAVRSEFTDC